MEKTPLAYDVTTYSKDGPFRDPVVRCYSCNKLLRAEAMRKTGVCLCGSRKIKNISGFTVEEKEQMIEWNVAEGFLKLFEEVDDG